MSIQDRSAHISICGPYNLGQSYKLGGLRRYQESGGKIDVDIVPEQVMVKLMMLSVGSINSLWHGMTRTNLLLSVISKSIAETSPLRSENVLSREWQTEDRIRGFAEER